MKSGYYYLIEGGKILHYSGSFERLLNFTASERTTDAEIWYNNKLVWVQRPEKYL